MKLENEKEYKTKMWQTVWVETLMLPCSFWSFLLDIFGIVQRCNSLPFSLTGCSAISSLSFVFSSLKLLGDVMSSSEILSFEN